MTSSAVTRLNRLLPLLGVALLVATVAVFAARDGGDDRSGASAPATAAAAAPAATNRVEIRDFLFSPASVTVEAGVKLTFTNADDAPHTATSGTSPKPDGRFDTGTLAKGKSASVTLSEPGTYSYYCSIHPFMKATVTVR